ncbi:hypothetical protein HMPREF9080_01701 [Cardiobacterium valvarum F0432]|uniref:Uncharacterized protein n=1 Tax=Cardiobacterium valvarum F0432 TaxID=797473 RepID=G9ZG00_9GAMM|nr:hypothetical protein HMPREF9080_01701 [Cardiobacterium valvarum F0432]
MWCPCFWKDFHLANYTVFSCTGHSPRPVWLFARGVLCLCYTALFFLFLYFSRDCIHEKVGIFRYVASACAGMRLAQRAGDV